MQIKFLVSLHHVDIKERLGRGDKLNDTTFISNDISLIDTIIPTELIPVMGMLEVEGIKSNKVFIYSIEEIPDDSDVMLYLINKLYLVQSFLSVIWLYQDHNIDSELGFVFYSNNGELSVSSNSIARINTLATGQRTKVKLSKELLRKIRESYIEWKPDTYDKPAYDTRRRYTKLLKASSRLEIALYHISAARAATDLGMKISHYCSSLETLFTTSQVELAHQISERLAVFIGDSADDKLSRYKKTKKAYSIRSKVVHGATFKEGDLEKIESSSVFCDESLRLIFVKIFSDTTVRSIFEGNNEILDNYMLGLVFGLDTTDI